MPTVTHTPITQPTISEGAFKELAFDIVNTMVNGETSPFKDMSLNLQDYLDDAGTELEAVQKAGIYSSFLRDAYNDINKQALSSAFSLLKANSDYILEHAQVDSKVQASEYNNQKVFAESLVLEAKYAQSDADKRLTEAEVALKLQQVTELRAKLKKQYGVAETVDTVLGDGSSTYRMFNSSWWKVKGGTGTDKAKFVNGLGVVITNPETQSGVPGLVAATSITSTLVNTLSPSAIDKQITGYDMANFKDVLKTLDEKAALMQNAKQGENPGDKALRNVILEQIIDVKLDMDSNGNINKVSGITPRCEQYCESRPAATVPPTRYP